MYLEFMLDRQEFQERLQSKLKTQNKIFRKYIIHKPWGAAMPALRTVALALVYPVTGYALPV